MRLSNNLFVSSNSLLGIFIASNLLAPFSKSLTLNAYPLKRLSPIGVFTAGRSRTAGGSFGDLVTIGRLAIVINSTLRAQQL